MNTENKKDANGAVCIILMLICLFCFILGGGSDSKTEDTSTTEQVTTEEISTTEKVSNTETFVDDLSKYLNKDVSTSIYNIYINDLGFDTLKFNKPSGDSNNYRVTANGYTTCLTAMNDGYCRIFIPNSPFVFYEDGKVLLTYKQFESSSIKPEDMPNYYTIAQLIIEDCLKSPKSADFPSTDEISYQKKDNLVAIKGYVDAENSFGAEVRSNYIVQFYVNDLESSSYETVYVEIDGEKTGEFIPYE